MICADLHPVQIDGVSYSATTRGALGKCFEPDTQLFGPRQVRLGTGRTIAQKYGIVDDRDAEVMITTVFGAAIPGHGSVRLTAKVGWGNETEPFPFTIDLRRFRLRDRAEELRCCAA